MQLEAHGLTRPSVAVKNGIKALCQARDYAVDLRRSLWDFAVEVASLRELGLTNSEFRWLLCKGYVEHGEETTLAEAGTRTFRRIGELTITSRTCFVLTELGAVFASKMYDESTPCSEFTGDGDRVPGDGSAYSLIPHWDKDRQELRVGTRIVKRFKTPAPNQEVILAALEEEHWPPRIDDPIPPHPNQDAKRRLHDVINSLNRNQQHSLIRFMGDGSGKGIRWELIEHGGDNGHAV